MALNYKKLVQVILDNAAPQQIYQAPPGSEVIVRGIKVVNKSGVTCSARLWHDGSADVNIILPPVDIVAGGWGDYDGVVLMEAQDTLYGQAGAADSIVVTVYGLVKS